VTERARERELHHDFHAHGPQSEGRHYDLPTISVSSSLRMLSIAVAGRRTQLSLFDRYIQ
jgi:hypothetical protein